MESTDKEQDIELVSENNKEIDSADKVDEDLKEDSDDNIEEKED